MEILILKNGEVFARTNDNEPGGAEYSLAVVPDAELPVYPDEPAGRGKTYELQFVGGVLAWVLVDRELTQDERIEVLEEELDTYKYPAWVQPTGAHDAYAIGARVSHNGKKWFNEVYESNVWEPGVFGWVEE